MVKNLKNVIIIVKTINLKNIITLKATSDKLQNNTITNNE